MVGAAQKVGAVAEEKQTVLKPVGLASDGKEEVALVGLTLQRMKSPGMTGTIIGM